MLIIEVQLTTRHSEALETDHVKHQQQRSGHDQRPDSVFMPDMLGRMTGGMNILIYTIKHNKPMPCKLI